MSRRSAPGRRGGCGVAALVAGLWIACGASTAQAACFSGIRSVARCEALVAAEAQLARGEALDAAQAFEKAAALEHAADIELGMVRSYLQSGEFRRAMAFASHTAGAHGNDAGGTALYFWLLQLSGQHEFAARLLDQARTRLPDSTLLSELNAQIASGAAFTSEAMLVPPARLAPYAVGDVPSAQAQLVASGMLLDQGRRALVPAQSVGAAARIWLRDGLGRTVAAHLERQIDALGVAILQIERPLAQGDDDAVQVAARDAFPGAPAYALAYAGGGEALPAWPWLHTGFLGSVDTASGKRRLGIDLPANAMLGGPVFDLSGR